MTMNYLKNYRLCMLTALITAGGMLAAAAPAHAEQADRNKPLVYSADHLSYDDLKQTTILTGNVEITKGTIIVRGDRAEVHQDPEGYSYATATRDKGLAYIRQKRDGVDEYFEGNAKRIDYDGKNDVSTLIGQAVARRLQGLTTVIDEVNGNTIRYDGETGFYTATSTGGKAQTGSASGRVHGMIAPSTTTPPPVTPTAPAAPAETAPVIRRIVPGASGSATPDNAASGASSESSTGVPGGTSAGLTAGIAASDAANAAADAAAAKSAAAGSNTRGATLTPAQTLEKTE